MQRGSRVPVRGTVLTASRETTTLNEPGRATTKGDVTDSGRPLTNRGSFDEEARADDTLAAATREPFDPPFEDGPTVNKFQVVFTEPRSGARVRISGVDFEIGAGRKRLGSRSAPGQRELGK